MPARHQAANTSRVVKVKLMALLAISIMKVITTVKSTKVK